jgi:hypothetical protein
MMSGKSPIFIVGCGHSGTSLLLRILGSHSRIGAIPFESSFALKWPAPCEASRQFFARCDNFARRMGKERWVEKTPRHILRLKEILQNFPEGKVLLMLRDGRDVACSIQDRCGSLEVGIDRWVRDNQAGRSFWDHPNVHLVRYEKLVADFENTLRTIFNFIGEEFEDSVRHYHETPKSYFAADIERPSNAFGENHERYRNWQMNQPLFDGRGKWHRLTEEEKRLIKEKAGNLLIQYGYAADLNW